VHERDSDEYSSAAFKLSDKLRSLPALAGIVEEGETDCFEGREEVRFIKADLESAPEITRNILKYAITGNRRMLDNAIAAAKFAASELLAIRGVQVKTYDEDRK